MTGVFTQPTREGMHTRRSAQVTRDAVSLGPTRHLLHKASLSILGDTTALLYMKKQTQGGCQNEKTKKHFPMKEQEKFLEKKN